jgi:pimeloyl-ACP methyl ester carboxylesterase
MTGESPAATLISRDPAPAALPLWRELLAAVDWVALRSSPVFYGFGAPRGDGSAVVLVPGFLGTDGYLREMHCWLRRIGYRPYMSGIGRNAECLDVLTRRLLETVETAHAETGARVHMIGHSLGGILSRSAATQRPQWVASVISLGSPFRGIRSHPIVLAASDRVRERITSARETGDRHACYTGYCSCDTVSAWAKRFPFSVSQAAIYTKTDGIVDWRFCVNDDPDTDIEVVGTHVGLAFNPFVYHAIALRLARFARAAWEQAAGRV